MNPTGNTGVQDVKGLETVAEQVTDAVFSPSPRCGVLLYGPAGVGKTMLMRGFQRTGKLPLLCISAAELAIRPVETAGKRLSELVQYAESVGGLTVFLDEVDVLREAHPATIALLHLTDCPCIRLVAATAYPWKVDSRVVRRLERRVYASRYQGYRRG